jgi:hypothetical protein
MLSARDKSLCSPLDHAIETGSVATVAAVCDAMLLEVGSTTNSGDFLNSILMPTRRSGPTVLHRLFRPRASARTEQQNLDPGTEVHTAASIEHMACLERVLFAPALPSNTLGALLERRDGAGYRALVAPDELQSCQHVSMVQ